MPFVFDFLIRCRLLPAILIFAWAFPAISIAQGKPLYERLPFNRITLTPQHNGTVVDVLPIDFGPRGRPNPLPRTRQELVVRFADNATKEFAVQWNAIEKIELFPELVFGEFLEILDELAVNVAALPSEPAASGQEDSTLAENFDRAYQYLLFLAEYRKELPDYDSSYRKFLYEEAVYRIKAGDFATGMTRFETLFSRDKNYPNLARTWGSAMEIVLDAHWKAGREDLCRQTLLRFRESYADHDVVRLWDERLFASTRSLCEQSRQAFEQFDFVKAHLLCERARRIAPELPELVEWGRELSARAPRVDVAVDVPLGEQLDRRQFGLPDRATERARRLLRLGLVEYVRPSLEGGIYETPLGTLQRTPGTKSLRWTFSDEQRQRLEFEPLDAAETVLYYSEADTPLSDVESGPATSAPELLFPSPDEMELRLREFPLIPEALFTDPMIASRRFTRPGGNGGEGAAGSGEPVFIAGPFLWDIEEEKRNAFLLREFSADVSGNISGNADREVPATPPNVIFEHAVLRGEEATELLLTGRVDLIDRLAPWELERLRKTPGVMTGRHAVPTIFFLVPNPNKALTASRTFRRALLYGLNRQGMLDRLADRSGEGSVLSAPFVKARSLGDPLGYGYDSLIAPRPYDPKLATALSLLAFNQLRDRDPEWEKLTAIPEIVLACPEREVSQLVGLMIRRQWETLRLRVRIVVYRNGESIGRDEEIDFWLVERNLKEPLLDAERIFGVGGMHGRPSPYMELALDGLRRSRDWAEAGKALHELHRLCFEETTVLPLWQLTEFYAHREGLSGIEPESGLIDLYQNIRRWKISPVKTK